MKYLVAENYRIDGKTAGSKARKDVETILKSKGFEHIVLYHSGEGRLKVIHNFWGALFSIMKKVKRGDICFFEHPYLPSIYSTLLGKFAKILMKKNKVITVLLIHDLNSVRLNRPSLKKEIKQLNNYRYVIVHNSQMLSFLQENGCCSKLLNLEVFDYLVEHREKQKEECNDIAIAGNLCKEKSGYIYSLGEISGLSFGLYGVGLDTKNITNNLIYHGAFDPDVLPFVINGRWGLVWDGDSIHTCEGLCGEYLRLNNPHKLSLYLAAGIPVIVWSNSAAALFVEENNVGIWVENLSELEDAIERVTPKMYAILCENVLKIGRKITSGNYLKSKLEIITKAIV